VDHHGQYFTFLPTIGFSTSLTIGASPKPGEPLVCGQAVARAAPRFDREKIEGPALGTGDEPRSGPRWEFDVGYLFHWEVKMNGLLSWGDESVGPRAESTRGFVPNLESLESRVVLSHGGKVKIDFEIANPHVPAHVSTLPPPAVHLAAAPAGPDGASEATGLVHVSGDQDGFDRVWVGSGDDIAIKRKATPILF
jgi:hypothetical protein